MERENWIIIYPVDKSTMTHTFELMKLAQIAGRGIFTDAITPIPIDGIISHINSTFSASLVFASSHNIDQRFRFSKTIACPSINVLKEPRNF